MRLMDDSAAPAGSTTAAALCWFVETSLVRGKTPAAEDDAANRFAGFRVLGQWHVIHALRDFIALHGIAFMRGDGFVEVVHGVFGL